LLVITPSTKGKPAPLARTAVFLDLLDHLAFPARTVSQVALVNPDSLASPDAQVPCARSPLLHHADLAHLDHPVLPDHRVRPETPAATVDLVAPVTTELLATLAHEDHKVIPDLLVPMVLPVSPVLPLPAPQLCPVTPDLRVTPVPTDHLAHPDLMDPTDNPADPDLRDHLATPAPTANPATTAVTDPPDLQDPLVNVVSARNIALLMAVSSSRMAV
jgi:hypothetical protein